MRLRLESASMRGTVVVVAVSLCACAPAGPERPTSKRTIECGPSGGYLAEFDPGDAKIGVDTLTVTFSKQKPTSRDADAAVRACIDATAKTVRIDYELLANAWFNDDGPLQLIDGSNHLAYDPKTGKTQTLNEREGVKPIETKRDGYTVRYQEDKILVSPFGKFATLDVLFEKPGTSSQITTILAREVKSAIEAQPAKLDTTAYAMTGPAREQIRGNGSRYLSVTFDAKSGELRDQDRSPIQ
jgi:hypothetical protein